MTTTETAEALGVTLGRIRQMIAAGTLASEKRGRDHLIPRATVEAAKERRTTPGSPISTGAGLRRRGKLPSVTP